ncbi:MAG: hypothetical protein HY243_14755 [Proteobacteria bacterium]|nr:hypothetical protein [Pseudomonadota bacterium]
MLTSFSMVLAVLFVANPARAVFVVPAHSLGCYGDDGHLYNSQSPDVPLPIARSFEGRGSVLTFRTCVDPDENTHYFVREPRPVRNGICRIFEHELFPGTGRDIEAVETQYPGGLDSSLKLRGWKDWPPQAWVERHYTPQSRILAQEGENECPPGDDKRYISVGALTDGMLKAFYQLWHRATDSPESFDKVFPSSIPYDEARQQLRNELFTQGHERPTVGILDCHEDNPAYCTAYLSNVLEMEFDFTDQGLTITNLRRSIVI